METNKTLHYNCFILKEKYGNIRSEDARDIFNKLISAKEVLIDLSIYNHLFDGDEYEKYLLHAETSVETRMVRLTLFKYINDSPCYTYTISYMVMQLKKTIYEVLRDMLTMSPHAEMTELNMDMNLIWEDGTDNEVEYYDPYKPVYTFKMNNSPIPEGIDPGEYWTEVREIRKTIRQSMLNYIAYNFKADTK